MWSHAMVARYLGAHQLLSYALEIGVLHYLSSLSWLRIIQWSIWYGLLSRYRRENGAGFSGYHRKSRVNNKGYTDK